MTMLPVTSFKDANADMSVIFSASSASEPIIRFPLTTVVLVAAKEATSSWSSTPHLRQILSRFSRPYSIFAGISVIDVTRKVRSLSQSVTVSGSGMIVAEVVYLNSTSRCSAIPYRNGYCYCIVRNVGRVRFPVHGHHDRCDEIFICIFRYNFIVFVTRSQKEQG